MTTVHKKFDLELGDELPARNTDGLAIVYMCPEGQEFCAGCATPVDKYVPIVSFKILRPPETATCNECEANIA